ncbi:coiled-coil domain-containing protein 149-B-like isoform X1 [Biomphalaria glabrata]|uniref:Coiled-coil domain-containing protein 149-B-like isoform X1 n=1 Tax=Biomphalaria glabrata TaxID=6526 RepID=A0A9W2YBY7_BIOGL|nr:coiled-coil domain-containing protein 149-B-like isoform X1 [Biomphalaria glabrata]XP_055860260.1 coiled-coil domain-containing protein 149-B-like isoform X1 [Biomphalaria glabrata]XP_055860269.1 coiled-coil domain-containing protein 149-B-like isoform X1 [Biomphalaria glabrata]XP_055860276.1 coiled-coil domain-containing protein 149-B-like isoform X1 [Biomphalaria glabrata]KAI8789567.1 nucleoprotein TPR isoform X1 [Biomphalaria glabrata]
MAHNNTSTESLASRFDTITTEYQICRRKLESKCEALLILSRELDQCRSERDQFKLMAEQLRDRYQMVKRQLTGDVPMSASIEIDPKTYSDIQTQTLARMLFDTKETNKSLKFEVDNLRQKLQDAEGDIKLLREQIARSRVGTTDEGLNTRHFPAHEREELVRQLEASREEYVQLERDLQQVLDEKEELVTERAAYRTKYERLNTELNYILGGDEKRIVDLDVLIMENRFLQERLKQMEEEKTMAIATVTKYKSILEKKKTKGILKLGQCRNDGLVITQKQIQQVMQNKSSISPSPQALADLQGLCGALLETINDKNLALSHQRKTNKLLGNRVNELEKKLKTLEVSGLWSVAGHFPNLEKLKAECEEIKTLVPHQFSQSTDSSSGAANIASDFESSASSSAVHSAGTSPYHKLNQLSRLDLEELDMLPTKEKHSQSTDKDLLIGAETINSCTETSLDLADVMSKNSEALRMALAEAMLRSLMNHESIGSSENLSNSAEELDDKTDYLDPEQREAAIWQCLKRDSEDDLEDLNDFNDVDDDDDVEREASEEFEHLLESVTSKLLVRSQELQKRKSYDQKVTAKPKQHNVYITEDFNTLGHYSLPVCNEVIVSSECREQGLGDKLIASDQQLNDFLVGERGLAETSDRISPLIPSDESKEQLSKDSPYLLGFASDSTSSPAEHVGFALTNSCVQIIEVLDIEGEQNDFQHVIPSEASSLVAHQTGSPQDLTEVDRSVDNKDENLIHCNNVNIKETFCEGEVQIM